MLQALSDWMVSLHFTSWVGGYEWVWPVCEIIHFVGMALLFGCIVLLDLRILGVGKGIPFSALERFVPLGIIGFCLNLITGFIFVAGNPTGTPMDYFAHNLAYQLKMLAIFLAGINALAVDPALAAGDLLRPPDHVRRRVALFARHCVKWQRDTWQRVATGALLALLAPAALPAVAGWGEFVDGLRVLPARMLARLPPSMQNDPQVQQEVARLAL
jgi:hypothetical protein